MKTKIFIILLLILAAVAPFKTALAYTLSVPIPPGLNGGNPTTEVTGGPAGYILVIYNFGMAFGVLLAMIMIVIGAIQYTVSEAIPMKEDARDRMLNAIWGLALLLTAFIIVQTINPKIDPLNPQNPFLLDLPTPLPPTPTPPPG